MTFSIVARSDDGESWGVAVASKFLAVGAAVPAARAGLGAVATQAEANVGWKRAALALLGEGLPAAEVVQLLCGADDRAEHRQLGVVDASGASATHTGESCLDWAGGLAEPGVAIQGNILAGPDVVAAMKSGWDAATGRTLGRRLLTALAAGDAAGGDRRGRQSAALYVVADLMARFLELIPVGNGDNLGGWIYEHVFASWASPINASLAFAICFVLVCLGLMWILYRRRIFLKA